MFSAKRDFGLRMEEESERGERDVAAMVHLLPRLSFGEGGQCCIEIGGDRIRWCLEHLVGS